MSSGETNKLKRDLMRANEVVATLRRELELMEKKLIEDKDHLEAENKLSRNQLVKMNEIIKKTEDDAIRRTEGKVQSEMELFRTLQKDFQTKEEMVKHLNGLLESKDDELQFFKQKLKETTADYKLSDAMRDIKDYREEKVLMVKQVQKQTTDLNKLSSDLENLIAENRLLREMAHVPENFGINIQDIKLAERDKIEDYKAKVRYLEKEVEKLTIERARLEHQLRNASSLFSDKPGERYKGLTAEQLALLDEFAMNLKSGKVQLPTTDDSKRLQREVNELKVQIDILEKGTYGGLWEILERFFGKKRDNGLAASELFDDPRVQANKTPKNLIESSDQLGKVNSEMLEEIKRLLAETLQRKPESDSVGPMPAQPTLFFPPSPMPGLFGNWNDIRGGVSYKFKTKIPMEGEEFDLADTFDTVTAKYEVAALQLQNIENMETIFRKEQELSALKYEVDDIRSAMKKNLLLQDELFRRYFEEKTGWEKEKEESKRALEETSTRADEMQVRLQVLEDTAKAIRERDAGSLEARLAELTQKVALQDVNLVRLTRKYGAMREEHKTLKDSYDKQEILQAEKEGELTEKCNSLISWKMKAIEQMRQMFKELKDSVPLEDHRAKVNELTIISEKYTDLINREKDYLHRLALKESTARELFEKTERMRDLREENVEIELELEVAKLRLDAIDPVYRQYLASFQQIVDTLKAKNISPTQLFSAYDKDKSGDISRVEFEEILQSLNIRLTRDDIDVLFLFVDLDGTQKIEYKEFVRRLRRAGVKIKRAEEEVLVAVYNALAKAELTLKQAFMIFDKDGDNLVSKKEVQSAFESMKLDVPKNAIDAIYELADITGDGLINADEWYRLFSTIVKDLSKLHAEEEEELDWRFKVMVSMDSAMKKQGVTMQEAFNMIDADQSGRLTFDELKSLFDNMSVRLRPGELSSLFNAIDRDQGGSISFNEFLNYFNDAVREAEKSQRKQLAAQRSANLKETGLFTRNEEAMKTVATANTLEMKVTLLKAREKSTSERLAALEVQLRGNADLIAQHERTIQQHVDAELKLNEEFFALREKYLRAEMMLTNCVAKEDGDYLRRLNDKQRMETVELRAAFNSYRELYETAVFQAKVMKLTAERRRGETDALEAAIKDLQSDGDESLMIGKLHHQMLFFKYNEGVLAKRYDGLLDELRRTKTQLAATENRVDEKDREWMETSSLFVEKIRTLERALNEIKGKVMPTLTIAKLEEQGKRLRELAEMKTELEGMHRALRDRNYELQLMCDFHENHKHTLEDLEQRLRKSSTDELSQQLLELSMRCSQYKLTELKAKSETTLAKEREAFHQRIAKQLTSGMKQLEEQLANWDMKYAKREDFWRKRHVETLALLNLTAEDGHPSAEEVLSKRKTIADIKLEPYNPANQRQANHNQMAAPVSTKTSSKVPPIPLKETDDELRQKYREISEALREKEKEIAVLKRTVGGLRDTGTVMEKETYMKFTNMIQEEDGKKLAYTAQMMIKTLNDVISERNAALDRKDEIISTLRSEAMEQKNKDSHEISRLSEMLHQRQVDVLGDVGRLLVADPMQVQATSQVLSRMTLQDINNLLAEKDSVISQLNVQLKAADDIRKKNEARIKELVRDVEDNKAQLADEKDRNDIKRLMKENEQLSKIVKAKNEDLEGCKRSIQRLIEENKKLMEKDDKKEDDVKGKVLKEKANSSELETRLKLVTDSVQDLNLKLRKAKAEITEMHTREIETRQKYTDLQEEHKKFQELYNKMRDELIDERKKKKPAGEEKKKEEPPTMGVELEKAKRDNVNLTKEIAALKKERPGADLLDDQGVLRSKEAFHFSTADEIVAAVRGWVRVNPGSDVLGEYRSIRPAPKGGMISRETFQQVLAFVGVRLKERDFVLLTESLNKDRLNNVDFFQFYHKLRGMEEKGVQGKIEEPREIASATVRREFHPRATKKAEPESKKVELIQLELQEVKRELIETTKQLKEWKEKALKLTKENETFKNKPLTKDAKDQRREVGGQDATLNAFPKPDVEARLRADIARLDDENERLRRIIEVDKEVELKMLREENTRLESEVKIIRTESLRTMSTIESMSRNPMGVKAEEFDVEKDKIIKNLKDKLESLREREKDLTMKLFEHEKQNRDLRFVNENQLMKVDRLTKRVTELEQQRVNR